MTNGAPVVRAFDAVVDDVDKVERTVVARINARTIDRLNSVIEPGGGVFDAYRKNPIVLWEHGKDPRRFTDPIGRSVWIKHSGGKRPADLIGKTRFLDDDFSRQRFEWYRDGTLNAFSIRFMPLDYGPPTRDEVRDWPDLDNGRPNETRGAFDGVLMHRRWELTEYSGTALPGNADCLVTERAANLLSLVQRGLLWLPDDVRPLIEAAAARAAEQPSGAEPPPEEQAEPESGAEPPALPDVAGARSIVEIARAMSVERKDMQKALRDEVVAMIDLLVYGRV